MDLIDWPGVIRNALWLVGLSVALAALSYISWWGAAQGMRLRQSLNLPRFQIPFAVGMTLFCASLAWGSTRSWERGLWIALTLSFVWQIIVLRRKP